jgi:hypothetical protein
VLQHIAAERKASEDRLTVMMALESLGKSDLTCKILPHSTSTAEYLDSLSALRASTEQLSEIVESPTANLLVARVLEPLGRFIKNLPLLRRQIDARREACADYDAYVRRLRAEQARGDAAEEARAEVKVASATAALQDASAAVASSLAAAEQARVLLVRDAAEVILAARVHIHVRCAEAMQPLLCRMPGSSVTCVDLSEGTSHAQTATMAKLAQQRPLTLGAAPATAPAG